MIGIEAEARAVIAGHVRRRSFPGYRKIGEGAYRTVYRAPSGIVYKVGYLHANLDEMYNYKKVVAKGLPHPLAVPTMHHFTEIHHTLSVMAVEFVPGRFPHECNGMFWNDPCGYRKTTCARNDRTASIASLARAATGLNDLHPLNFKIHQGKYYIIDLNL